LNVLDLRNVSLVIGRRKILNNLSWTIKRGQHWALIGPNGSGKTTLLQIINGYLWPSTGTAAVLGKSFGSYDLRELRKRIGFVSSFVSEKIPAELPVLDVVMGGSSSAIGLFELPSRLQLKKAKLILKNVGCGPLYKSQYGSLSDGEKQRVLIARALMSSPTLLALDEPCSGLDIAAREAFLKFLTRIMKRKESTVIFATHRIDEIVRTLSHAMIIRGGKVVSSGAKSSVLTSRNVTNAFGAKIFVIQHGGRYQAFCP
jgi:iron complex transport system ATP-binding protein